MSIKSAGSVAIQKDLEDAVVGEASLTWTLSQEETLSFRADQKATMMLNFRLADGTRAASNKTELCFRDNHITEVI